MLPPQSLELLTGYLDGNLSPRQRRAVDRLLQRSDAARALLERLRGDAERLRQLSTPATPADLSEAVLATIVRRRLRPGRPPAGRRTVFPVWTGYAAAAAVLLVVAAATYFDAATVAEPPGETGGVARQADAADQPGDAPRRPAPVAGGKPTPPKPQPPAAPDQEDPFGPDLPSRPEGTRPPPASEQVKPDDRIHTSPIREGRPHLRRVEADLPELYPVHALKQTVNADRLTAQLGTAPLFRVELPCRDATRGFDYVRAALAARGVTLVIDPSAKNLLGKPQWKTDYAVFVENLTPAQLTAVLAEAGAADLAVARKRAADRRFEPHLVVKTAAAVDRRELVGLLRFDPVTERPSGPAGGPTGVVLNLSAIASRRTERFRETRQAAQPGTVQVLLVMRNVGS